MNALEDLKLKRVTVVQGLLGMGSMLATAPLMGERRAGSYSGV